MVEPTKTKVCDACDQEIGESETTCPKCGVVFEDLESDLKAAEVIFEKRKKRATLPEPPAPLPPPKKKSIFKALGNAVKK